MIAVTGATGNLGRLVLDDLLDRGVPLAEIVAAVCGPGQVADLAERGLEIREAVATVARPPLPSSGPSGSSG